MGNKKLGLNEYTMLAWCFALGLYFTPGFWKHIGFVCAFIAGALLSHLLTIKRQEKLAFDAKKKIKRNNELLAGLSKENLEKELIRREKWK